jgi:hypothetical protein
MDILRDMVDGERQLERLLEIADWMERKGKGAGEVSPDGGPVEIPVRADQMALADKEMTLRLKLLEKVMPSLKAVEHSGEVDTGPRRTMNKTELAHRLGVLLSDDNNDEEVTEMLPFLE